MPDARLADLKARIDSAIARHGFTQEEMRAVRRRWLLQRSAEALARLGASFDEVNNASLRLTALLAPLERAMREQLAHFRGMKGQAHG